MKSESFKIKNECCVCHHNTRFRDYAHSRVELIYVASVRSR